MLVFSSVQKGNVCQSKTIKHLFVWWPNMLMLCLVAKRYQLNWNIVQANKKFCQRSKLTGILTKCFFVFIAIAIFHSCYNYHNCNFHNTTVQHGCSNQNNNHSLSYPINRCFSSVQYMRWKEKKIKMNFVEHCKLLPSLIQVFSDN